MKSTTDTGLVVIEICVTVLLLCVVSVIGQSVDENQSRPADNCSHHICCSDNVDLNNRNNCTSIYRYCKTKQNLQSVVCCINGSSGDYRPLCQDATWFNATASSCSLEDQDQCWPNCENIICNIKKTNSSNRSENEVPNKHLGSPNGDNGQTFTATVILEVLSGVIVVGLIVILITFTYLRVKKWRKSETADSDAIVKPILTANEIVESPVALHDGTNRIDSKDSYCSDAEDENLLKNESKTEEIKNGDWEKKLNYIVVELHQGTKFPELVSEGKKLPSDSVEYSTIDQAATLRLANEIDNSR